jgi:hypothetical protein
MADETITQLWTAHASSMKDVEIVKEKDQNNFTSSTGFKYEFIWAKKESMIVVFPLHSDLGYEFAVVDGEIQWKHPEGAEAYLGDDVREFADLWIKKIVKLKAFL